MENNNFIENVILNIENLIFNYDKVYLSDIFNPYRRDKEKFENYENNYSKKLKSVIHFFYDTQVSLFTEFKDLQDKNSIREFFKNKFWDYLVENRISLIEVMALKNDIIKFEDDNIKYFLRQFAKLDRIEVVKIDSTDFDKRKHSRYELKSNDKKLYIGIDKRFNYDNLKEYFLHLEDNFYPQILKKYDIKL